MKLYRVLVPVRDIEAGSTFYGTVFESPGERVAVNRHYFDCDGVVFACLDPLGRDEIVPNPEHLYLSTDEPLEAVRDRWLAAGGTLEADIDSYPWGETSFYGIDPWGNHIVFVRGGTEFTGSRFVP